MPLFEPTAWNDTGSLVQLSGTTDAVTVGGTTELAKFAVDGDTDEIQLLVQGNATQTTSLVVLETSAGTDLMTFSNSGNMLFATAGEVQFRATTNRVYSRTTDVLALEGNVTTEIGKDGDCALFLTTLRSLYPTTDLKADLGKTASNRVNDIFAKKVHVIAGSTSNEIAKVGGVIHINTTAVGNINAGEDTLMSYTIAANTLDTNKQSIRFTASGTIASSVNTKRIKVHFGTKVIFDTGAAGIPVSAAIDWVIEGMVIRTGTATQVSNVSMNTNNATLASYADDNTATEDETAAITFKLTGESASTTDDIIQKQFIIDWMPAPG